MLKIMMSEIHVASVLVAPLIGIVLGFIWYGPLFGKQWMSLVNLNEEKIKESNMVRTFGIMTANALIISFIIAIILNIVQQTLDAPISIFESLLIADLIWLMYGAAGLTNAVFAQSSLKLWLLESAYWLLTIMSIAIVHTIWT